MKSNSPGEGHRLANGLGVPRRRHVASLARHLFRHPRSAAALWSDRQTKFRYELAIGAIFKDEARYLDEWLTFHRGVGVDHFYLYNNESSDDFPDVLAPWIDAGIVTLIDWPVNPPQIPAYNDCVRRFRKATRWIAFIDIDEFLFSPTARDLRSVLVEFANLPAIFVYWHLFGSSGHINRPAGSVIEAYTRRLDSDIDIVSMKRKMPDGVTGKPGKGKSIVNPRLVRKINIHRPKSLWFGDVLDENRLPKKSPSTRILRINHYWSRSIEDLYEKVGRSRTGSIETPRDLEGSLNWEASLNAVEDLTIQPLWEAIKADATYERTGPSR